MKKAIKICSLVICIILVSILHNNVVAIEKTDVYDNVYSQDADIFAKILSNEKVYCDVQMDQNFDGKSVIVVLNRSVGGINKKHEKNLFEGVEIKNIVDLTAISGDHIDTELTKSKNYQKALNGKLKINPETYEQILKLELPTDNKENVIKVIKKLEKIDGIKYVGPNYYSMPTAIPNDIDFLSKQEVLQEDMINAVGAWNLTTGSSSVKVGIMDSGIATHTDLNYNVIIGKDFYNTNASTITNDDPTGHGTAVAGIVGAMGNNEVGMSGVCWDVSLVPLQVVEKKIEDGKIKHVYPNSAVIEGIKFAIENNIPIINFSAGALGTPYDLNAMIANYPGLFVCAAGNAEKNSLPNNNDVTPFSPSDLSKTLPNVISVGNSDSNDNIVYDSNYGATSVSLFAPGVDVYTTTLNDTHTEKSGTSISAPHVTGVAALILSIRPDLSAEQLKDCILNSVDIVPALAGKCVTGGRLNAYKALQMATETQTFSADANGDGRSDMILIRGVNGRFVITTYLGKSDGSFGEPINSTSTRGFTYGNPAFIGDVNGDGRSDVIVHYEVNGYRVLVVYKGNTNGTFSEGVHLSSSRAHNPSRWPCQFFVDDVNGDGKDDFIVHWRNDSGKRANIVYTGTSTGIFNDAVDTFNSTNNYEAGDAVYTGDFNGDGYSDMLVHFRASNDCHGLLLYKGTSSASYAAGVKFYSSYTCNDEDEAYKSYKGFVDDVNGDGRDDFIIHFKNSSGKRATMVFNGSATGTFSEAVVTNSTNGFVLNDPAFVGDINGDGMADLVVQWRNSVDKRNLLSYKANSNSTYNAGINFLTTNTQHPINYPAQFFVSDANGDNRDDFIVKWKKSDNTVAFLTYLGTTGTSFTAGVMTTPTTSVPYYNWN